MSIYASHCAYTVVHGNVIKRQFCPRDDAIKYCRQKKKQAIARLGPAIIKHMSKFRKRRRENFHGLFPEQCRAHCALGPSAWWGASRAYMHKSGWGPATHTHPL